MQEKEPQNSNAKSNQTDGKDYYLNEEGNIVFTAAYHLKRGYCCGNNCKNCPYTAPISEATKI